MVWTDLLVRQLGNFNWRPGWCNNIVTTTDLIVLTYNCLDVLYLSPSIQSKYSTIGPQLKLPILGNNSIHALSVLQTCFLSSCFVM